MPKNATTAEKLAAIDALRETRNAGQDTEIELRRQKRDADADEVWARTQRLTTEIDILIGKLMDAWVKETRALTADVQESTQCVNAALEKIKQLQQIAKQVAAVVSELEKVIAIAAKLLV